MVKLILLGFIARGNSAGDIGAVICDDVGGGGQAVVLQHRIVIGGGRSGRDNRDVCGGLGGRQIEKFPGFRCCRYSYRNSIGMAVAGNTTQ